MHLIFFTVPRSVIGWLIVGLIAGWLAGKVSRGRGFGCIANVILGLIGAILGGWIFTKLNIPGNGLIYSIAAATLGAVVLVTLARLFSGGGE
ncbi:MAG: GlsB/YeaQ/YmgE family stress response membrane protein [Acidobacteriia bacterium]|nr:GlsB/YeaQ/YmgE family stress response membrane protein [Terriglobia bacterium]